MIRQTLGSQKGMASFEFAGVAMVVMALAFGIVEFGSLIRAQAIVTNVTREGGSLASRDLKNGQELLTVLEQSTWPLNFGCPLNQDGGVEAGCDQNALDRQFKIYITKINAGTSETNAPTCNTPLESGSLAGAGISSPNQDLYCGLTEELWRTLEYNENYSTSGNGTSLLSQLTVVKVYYRYDPLTPLAKLLQVVPYFGASTGNIMNFHSGNAENPEQGSEDSFLLGSKAIF
ncbi:TadE/TadG family type IV pilus assembly protein [Nitrospira sp. M1]